ncbi:MAG TPA: secretin N-terminal domain-containing protein, partial [Humisphaera sp.]
VNADANEVLRYLSERAGLTINPEVAIPPSAKITTTSIQASVTADEAIAQMNPQLKPAGIYILRQGTQLRVVNWETAKKNTKVFLGADPDLIPDTQELITQVVPLRNVDATRLRQDLATIIPIGSDVAANAASNCLVITDTSANIKRIVHITSALDKGSSADILTIKLQNATASTVAQLIGTVFRADASQRGGGSSRGGGGGGFPGGGDPRQPGGGGGNDAALRAGTVNAAADERTNTIVVTGPSESLKLVKKVVEEIDKDATKLSLTVFPLKFGDAVAVAKLINSVFTPSTSGSNSQQRPGGFFPGGEGGDGGDGGGRRSSRGGTEAAGASMDAALRGGKVNAVSDERTNSVIVTAPELAMPRIREMIEELEKQDVAENSMFIYPLRNGQAANLEYVLNNLFGNSTASGTGTNRGGTTNNGRGGTTTTGGRTGGSTGFGAQTSTAGGTGTGRTRGTTTTGGNQFGFGFGGFGGAGISNQSQRVANELTGQVYVVSDPDTNSLLVTVATRYAEPVKKIIAELDRPVPQVLIKVLVAEVTHDDGVDFGTDFSFTNTRASGEGTTVGGNFGNGALTNGIVAAVLEDKINVKLHALASKGKLDVLSRPYILASDNQQASITVGNEVPFITNTRITDTGQQINTIQYQDVGIILTVTPRINPDGLVIMDVIPEISQLTGTTVPISDGVAAPVIAKRSAESRVGVRSGNTVVIGGLMEDRKTVTVSKIPLLGDIPVLGNIFARTQVSKSKTELLIFLTPHVAQQPDHLQGATDQIRDGLKIAPHAVTDGMFDNIVDKEQSRGDMPVTRPTNPNDVSKTFPLPPIRQRSQQGGGTGVDVPSGAGFGPPQ